VEGDRGGQGFEYFTVRVEERSLAPENGRSSSYLKKIAAG
jgi:hypothetical protein